MDPVFKIVGQVNRKMWYEDTLYRLRAKWLRIICYLVACCLGLTIIFTAVSWIEAGKIVWNNSDVILAIEFVFFIVYDRVIAFLNSLILQRKVYKKSGLPYVPFEALFYEDRMEWIFRKGTPVEYYSWIRKLKITKNMYVLTRPGKEGGRFLIPKDGFVVGSSLAFEQFIKSKIAL